jgi:threonine dehydrogenase-like Zn-dependent dehydrogenase
MKAVCWFGRQEVRVEEVPDAHLINPRDAVIRVTSAAICGSDIHLYNGLIPSMRKGDILGHVFMGEVVDVGPGVENLRRGDRVVVPFAISCGRCQPCVDGLFSLCDNSNPNAGQLDALYGMAGAGLFGYSHLYGGYAGGQAEYVRVPFADVGPLKIDSDVADENVLFLGDVLSTAYMAAWCRPPTFIISHRLPLEDAPDADRRFTNKEPGYTKVLLSPQADLARPLTEADEAAEEPSAAVPLPGGVTGA